MHFAPSAMGRKAGSLVASGFSCTLVCSLCSSSLPGFDFLVQSSTDLTEPQILCHFPSLSLRHSTTFDVNKFHLLEFLSAKAVSL